MSRLLPISGHLPRTLALIGLVVAAAVGLGLAVNAALSSDSPPPKAAGGFVNSAGRPIHPLVLAPLLPRLITPHDDNGAPLCRSTDADTTLQTITEVVPRVVTDDDGRWYCVSGPGVQTDSLQLADDESFGYRLLGQTTSGVAVVMTRDTCQYSGPGHVWLLFVRVESVPGLSDPARRSTQVRLVGYRMPAWRRCNDPKCAIAHTDPANACERHWAPEYRVVGDRLEVSWRWDPESWINPAPVRPSTTPATEIVDLGHL